MDIKDLRNMPAELKKLIENIGLSQNPKIGRGYGKTIPNPPREFPDYVFEEFPKMMAEKVTQEWVDKWRMKNSYMDAGSNQRCYLGAAPKIGTMNARMATVEDVDAGFATEVGGYVVVQNAAEEKAFYAHLAKQEGGAEEPPKPVAVSIKDVVAASDRDEAPAPRRRGRPKRAARTVAELPADA